MKAAIEWIRSDVAIVRGGPDFERLRDPYTFVCTVVMETPTHGHIKGMAGDLNTNPRLAYRAIKEALHDCGVYTAEWERRKSGRIKHVFAT